MGQNEINFNPKYILCKKIVTSDNTVRKEKTNIKGKLAFC